VEVRSIIMYVSLKYANASQDDMVREIRDKDNVAVGQMVVDHECLKVGVWYDGDFTAGAVKICHDSLLVGVFVGCQVDIPKRCRSRCW
jgi:hypothetical protein